MQQFMIMQNVKHNMKMSTSQTTCTPHPTRQKERRNSHSSLTKKQKRNNPVKNAAAICSSEKCKHKPIIDQSTLYQLTQQYDCINNAMFTLCLPEN
mmetsp:Transcript_10196/g.16973  ORF Transcript_10196/g.16973 Transcript_10196/m.16973 type:complete len:96 (-) Transcript_10196:775-1062(-)